MTTLQNQLKTLLDQGDKIHLKWDCGGDEALIEIAINGTTIGYQHEIAEALDMYILNLLELPSAGEFSMDGTGEIIQEGDKLYLVCESTWRGYEDYTNTGEELGWKDVNERADEHSGKWVLFE